MRKIFLIAADFLSSCHSRLSGIFQKDSGRAGVTKRVMVVFSPIGLLIAFGLLAGCIGTPLTDAAKRGDIQEINSLLDSGANINEEAGSWAPLAWALYYRQTRAAKLLIDRGADINLIGSLGDTPLIYAAWRGNFEIVNLLLEKGADLEYGLLTCEQRTGMSVWGAFYKDCVATLKSVKAKRHPKQEMSEEKLATMVQTAVEKASKDKKKTKSSVLSDIDKPSFTLSDKIMGDNDLAVIIGIEGYQNIPKSDFSHDDAKLVKEYVKALGFKERNIELLTDEKATKSSIEKSLEVWLKNKAKANSRVFVYYSGHGAPEPKTGDAYIVPYDGDPNYLEVTGYSLKRLYDNLGKLQVKEVTVVLDSCFSGAGGRSVLAKGARPLVMIADIKAIPSNMAVLSATQGTQISTSSPEKGHGVFTYYFLKALKDGKKTIAEIYEYIKPLVEDEAKQLNVQQSPSISPDVNKLKGRFGLRE